MSRIIRWFVPLDKSPDIKDVDKIFEECFKGQHPDVEIKKNKDKDEKGG